MKTQVISVLAKYFYDLGKKVVLITPGKKAADELCKRIKSLYNITLPTPDGRLQNIITQGILNRKDIKDPTKLMLLEKEWRSVDVILSDESEYSINSDGGQFLLDRFTGAQKWYGFSGTSDKQYGEIISFQEGLSDNVIRNRHLIKYFGPSTVFRLPSNMEVNMIKVRTTAFASVRFEESDFEKGNVYLRVMTRLFTDPEICKVMVRTIKRYPMCYIPLNNLKDIISTWIDVYWKGVFRILLICAEGYIYYDLDGTRTKLKDLSVACEYVRDGKVDVIPSTSAGFRALDLPGLTNVLLLSGRVAGVVLQSIGRCGRGTAMNIIGLDSISGRTIPIHTKGMKERDELIKKYYNYCNIIESDIYDVNL